MTKRWETIRVFISSTFRDMHAERDYLVKVTFPRLRERLEAYQYHLEDIDLRWGVTADQVNNDQALELCLQQIDECRPFFVGILGERYGWIPEKMAMDAAAKYGWIQHHTGKSITELEILYGVLQKKEMEGHAVFCFRDMSFTDDVPSWMRNEMAAENAVSAEKLGILKDKIRNAEPAVSLFENYPCHYAGIRVNPRILHMEVSESDWIILEGVITDGFVSFKQYDILNYRLKEIIKRNAIVYLDGLKAFGDWIFEELWKRIMAEYNLTETPPLDRLVQGNPLDYEAQFHERFIESRTRVYVPREKVRQELKDYLGSTGTEPCLVTGPSGSGKSAILADLAQSLKCDHSLLLIPHFVGASPSSTSLRQMLRRFCEVLKGELQYTDDIPYEINPLIECFRKFIADVPTSRKVVLLIDALNQLDETDFAHGMYWLPVKLPSHAKIVCSCVKDAYRDEEIPKAFKRRPHQAVKVEPLNDQERIDIIRVVPTLSAKTLDADQVKLLVDNGATRNPLYLLVALEELKGFGSFEHLNARITQFPKETFNAVPEILGQVVERLLDEFETSVVKSILCFLACSRKGMTEQELVELIEGIGTEESTSDLFVILRQLRPYLSRRGEAVDFLYRDLNKVAKQKWLTSDEKVRSVHADLARYFRVKADPAADSTWTSKYLRGISELPFHLIQAELWDDLEAMITDLRFIQEKCTEIGLAEFTDDILHAISVVTIRMDSVESNTVARLDTILRRLFHAAQAESENIIHWPAIGAQQVFNRCQGEKTFIPFHGTQDTNILALTSVAPWSMEENAKAVWRGCLPIAFSPTGDRVWTVTKRGVLTKIQTGTGIPRTVSQEKFEPLRHIEYQIDGQSEQLLIMDLCGRIVVVDLTTGALREYARIDLGEGIIAACKKCPWGLVVVITFADHSPAKLGTIDIANESGLIEIASLGFGFFLHSPLWVSPTKPLALTSYGEFATKVALVNYRRGTILSTYEEHTSFIASCCAIPEHDIAVSTDMENSFRMWRLYTGETVLNMSTSPFGYVHCLTWDSMRECLLGMIHTRHHGVRVDIYSWNLRKSEANAVTSCLSERPTDFIISKELDLLVSGVTPDSRLEEHSGSLRAWDMNWITRPEQPNSVDQFTHHSNAVVGFLPLDHQRFVSVSWGGELWIRDSRTAEVLERLEQFDGLIDYIGMSESGEYLIVGGTNADIDFDGLQPRFEDVREVFAAYRFDRNTKALQRVEVQVVKEEPLPGLHGDEEILLVSHKNGRYHPMLSMINQNTNGIILRKQAYSSLFETLGHLRTRAWEQSIGAINPSEKTRIESLKEMFPKICDWILTQNEHRNIVVLTDSSVCRIDLDADIVEVVAELDKVNYYFAMSAIDGEKQVFILSLKGLEVWDIVEHHMDAFVPMTSQPTCIHLLDPTNIIVGDSRGWLWRYSLTSKAISDYASHHGTSAH